MMTAGMAAASPKAVASSASAMPGATTARLVVCDFEIPMKLFMMPHTVPNKPTKGAVAPMVASTPVPRLILRPNAASMRSRRDAMRSLRPSRSMASAETRISAIAAATRSPAGAGRSAAFAADNVSTPASAARALRARRLARAISIVFASQTVQVMTDATARPIMTAFTTQSADTNMPQGERSRGSAAAPTTGPLGVSDVCAKAAPASGSHAAKLGSTYCLAQCQSLISKVLVFAAHVGREPVTNMAIALRRIAGSEPHVCKGANAGAGQQHLVLGVRDVVADVVVEQVGADETDRVFAHVAGAPVCRLPAIAHFGAQVIVPR